MQCVSSELWNMVVEKKLNGVLTLLRDVESTGVSWQGLMLLWKSKATTSAITWEIHKKLDTDVVILILIGSRFNLKTGNTLLLGRIVLATNLRMITLTSQN